MLNGTAAGQRSPVGVRLQDLRQCLGDRFACEEPLARQHLEEHAPERPDVRALVRLAPLCLLRLHVRGRAEDHAYTGHHGWRSDRGRETCVGPALAGP